MRAQVAETGLVLFLTAGVVAAVGQIPWAKAEDPYRQVAQVSVEEPATLITMTDHFEFVPSEVTVRVGDLVLWRNTSRLVHSVTASPRLAMDRRHAKLPWGAPAFDSSGLNPGDEFVYKFKVPGTYRYFSLPYENEGMVGTVRVVR